MTFMVAANVTGCGVYGPPADSSDESQETQVPTEVSEVIETDG